jgi:hypothetical protein
MKYTVFHLTVFNDNNGLRFDKRTEKEYYSHPAVFIINETFPCRMWLFFTLSE